MSWPDQLGAQQPRRWLADPPLLQRVSADTQQQEQDRILDLEILDSTHGWGRGTTAVIPNPNAAPNGSECQVFAETKYSLCAPFLNFWQRNGGLPVFGFPITDTRDEINQTDGITYSTVWTERERLEYHPELRGTPYEILLGLLGAEDLRVRGYLS